MNDKASFFLTKKAATFKYKIMLYSEKQSIFLFYIFGETLYLSLYLSLSVSVFILAS